MATPNNTAPLLTDTGALVALLLADDPNHAFMVQTIRALPGRTKGTLLTTTIACITETVYFLGKAAGWDGQDLLHRLIKAGQLRIALPTTEEIAATWDYWRSTGTFPVILPTVVFLPMQML